MHQLQLTISDLVLEIHDTHHPLGPSLYYEDQKAPAKKRTDAFWKERVPKYLGYFEGLLAANGGTYVTGRRLTYVDLSLFQIVEGLAKDQDLSRFIVPPGLGTMAGPLGALALAADAEMQVKASPPTITAALR